MSSAKKNTSVKEPCVLLISLGCPKNFVDTEQAAADLVTHGCGLAFSYEEADVVFINTCAFLLSARNEASEHIEYALEWKKSKPGRIVIVSGCVVNWDKSGDYRRRYPDVDAWLCVDRTHTLGSAVQAVLSGKAAEKRKSEQNPARLPLTPPHYAWLRIADGCDNCCSYCLIPSIRGGLHSRPEKDIVEEAEHLIRSGVRELLIIAQDTSAYGRDFDGQPHLADLLKKLDRISGGSEDYLLRLMYLHPGSVTDELLDVMDETKHLVRCVEMPIQHVSDSMLKRMNRHVSEARLRVVVAELKKRKYAVRTTLMTGFPGETEDDLKKLLQFTEETEFERLGVFAWSSEPGTPASKMKGQIPEKERERRRELLMKAQQKISRANNRKMLGTSVEVIIDEIVPEKHICSGRTMLDIPDIDNEVKIVDVPETAIRRMTSGDRIRIQVQHAGNYGIKGVPLIKKNENRKRRIK